MIYLSASSIKDFISCERKYWYRRYGKGHGEITEAADRGTAVHKVIEKYWDNPDDGFEFLNTLYSNENFNLIKAQTALDSFYTNFRNLCGKDDLIEEKFKIDFTKGVKIIGVFDRVLPTKVIFDWKTNRSVPRNLESDVQFMLYYHAYTKLHDRPPAAVYFASLTAGRLVRFKYNPELFFILYNEIIPDMLENIKKKKFNPTGLYRYTTCKYCFYRNHCHQTLGVEKRNELDSKEFNFG